LDSEQRVIHRRRGDFDRFESADLRAASCEECGRDIFRRRSEPRAPNLCSLCRERRWWTIHLRLAGWKA
jgi:hypothetical protein